MAQWQTADAPRQFSQLIATAETQGPQVVMHHQEPVAVVLSPADYRRLVRQADANLAARLAASPFEPGELDGIDADLGDDEPSDAVAPRRAAGHGR